ncbi:allantoin permease [Alloscardovia macacae]|uniref:Allantoin permease n=2 Tax=Alloscardovia macacae TaxID=1160091 RepID=A0A1Y2STQ9_9BIFI|nr:allantoin permease [Alloscardovia macacae]OTA29913.1 allantoin permease [Alloscardovia macacae]
MLSKVEQRGLEPVPDDQRNGTPGQLFWVWFAANISILGIPLGATLVSLGLNVWQAILATAVGSFGSFALVGVISVAGRNGGAPSLGLSRAMFGVRGNIAPSFVAILSRWGWETVNTITGAFALLSLCAIIFHTPVGAKQVPLLVLVFILIFVGLTIAVAGVGYDFLAEVQKWATWIFGALTLLVAGYLAATVDWSMVLSGKPGSLSAVLIGIGTIAAGTGIGWVNSGADMARYQKREVKTSSLIWSAAAGAGIPLVIVISVGAIMTAGGSGLASAADPVAAVRDALPAWVSIPYLIVAFAGLVMCNSQSVYSAGFGILALGVRIPRANAVLVDVVVITAGALYFTLGFDGFYGPFITFISLLSVPLAAWTGIFLVDMIGRRTYDGESLIDLSPQSRYWYKSGFNVAGCVSWLIAFVVGFLFVTAQVSAEEVWFSGPLADTFIGQNGLAWLVTLLLSGALYTLMGGATAKNDGGSHE